MFDMPSANISWATYWKWFCSEDQADKKILFNINLLSTHHTSMPGNLDTCSITNYKALPKSSCENG